MTVWMVECMHDGPHVLARWSANLSKACNLLSWMNHCRGACSEKVPFLQPCPYPCPCPCHCTCPSLIFAIYQNGICVIGNLGIENQMGVYDHVAPLDCAQVIVPLCMCAHRLVCKDVRARVCMCVRACSLTLCHAERPSSCAWKREGTTHI